MSNTEITKINGRAYVKSGNNVYEVGGGGGSCALPEITTEDEGKFVRVVDGAYALVALKNYSGEVR